MGASRKYGAGALPRRVLASAGAVVVVAVLVASGVRTASASIDSAPPATGIAVSGSLDAAGLMPGGRVQRVVTLTSAHGAFDVSAEVSSILDTDRTDGLQLSADICSGSWQVSGAAVTCAGTTRSLFASRPVVGRTTLEAQAGGMLQVRLTVMLPASADERFLGQRSTLTYRLIR